MVDPPTSELPHRKRREIPLGLPTLNLDGFFDMPPARQNARLRIWEESLYTFLREQQEAALGEYFKREIEPKLVTHELGEARAADLLSQATQNLQKTNDLPELVEKSIREMRTVMNQGEKLKRELEGWDGKLEEEIREVQQRLRTDLEELAEEYRKKVTEEIRRETKQSKEDINSASRKASRAQKWTVFGGLATLAIAASLVHYQNISNLATTIAQGAKKVADYAVKQISELKSEFSTYKETEENKHEAIRKSLEKNSVQSNQIRDSLNARIDEVIKTQTEQAKDSQDQLASQDQFLRRCVQMYLDTSETRLTLRIGDLRGEMDACYDKLRLRDNKLEEGVGAALGGYSALAKAIKDTNQKVGVMDIVDGALNQDAKAKEERITKLETTVNGLTGEVRTLTEKNSAYEAKFKAYEQERQRQPVKRGWFK